MPAVFQSLQDMDEQRVRMIQVVGALIAINHGNNNRTFQMLQNFMRKSAQTEQDVLPIVGQCLEGVHRCTDSINEKEVSMSILR